MAARVRAMPPAVRAIRRQLQAARRFFLRPLMASPPLLVPDRADVRHGFDLAARYSGRNRRAQEQPVVGEPGASATGGLCFWRAGSVSDRSSLFSASRERERPEFFVFGEPGA